MAEQTQPGVIAQARAAAPQAVQPASVASVQPAPVQQPEPTQGFNAPTTNGFASQPQVAPEPVAQQAPVETVVTDNDRTRQQFDKLTDTNQRLAQTNELLRQELLTQQQARQKSQQQFAPVQQVPSAQPQQSAMPKLSDYIDVDPTTGERFVNEAKFNAAVAEIYQKASRAEETVQQYVQTAEQREIVRQEREAYSTYPELNPSGGKFDPRLSQNTRAIIYDSMINPQDYGGRPLSFKEAADYVAKGQIGSTTPQPLQAIPTPTVNEANQVQKEQAAVSVPSVPQQMSQDVDTEREYQKLVMQTRTGSDQAIAQRLLSATHKIEDVERQSTGN